jgi:hypothetical protein
MAAANNTVSYSSFDVVAGGISPYMAWLIQRVDWCTRTLGSFNPSASVGFRFQLCTGTQTALLAVDDDNVVGHADVSFIHDTEGSTMQLFPVSWAGPVLVAARTLTGLVDANADVVTNFQTAALTMTVWYRWVEMDKDTWYEVQQAQGILT